MKPYVPRLDRLCDENDRRDAVHVAVLPAVAAQRLLPGQHVGLNAAGRADANEEPIGVVSPFLLDPVKRGQRFFLCLYQDSVTSLRHVWTHPKVHDEATPPKNDDNQDDDEDDNCSC